MKGKKIKLNKDKRKPNPRKPEPCFFVAVGMALQKKGMGPVSAGLEHFIVTDGLFARQKIACSFWLNNSVGQTLLMPMPIPFVFNKPCTEHTSGFKKDSVTH